MPDAHKPLGFLPPSRWNFELSTRQLSVLIVLMILAGLLLLYAWPVDSAYLKTQPASIALMSEGKWVALSGRIASVDERPTGTSVQICDESSHCVRDFSGQSVMQAGDLAMAEPGQTLQVWGEVAAATGGTRYVRIHRASILDGMWE